MTISSRFKALVRMTPAKDGSTSSARWSLVRSAARTRKLTSPVVVAAMVFAVSVAGPVLAPNTALAAQVACTPDAGYSLCQEFTYSGADQTVTVPAGYDASNVKVKLWGGGGGGIDYQQMNARCRRLHHRRARPDGQQDGDRDRRWRRSARVLGC